MADPESPLDPAEGSAGEPAAEAAGEPVEVPPESLSPQALRGVLEAFVTRDGTDYGAVERTLEEKVADVRRQLGRGEVRIVFDPESGTVNVLPIQEGGSRRRGGPMPPR